MDALVKNCLSKRRIFCSNSFHEGFISVRDIRQLVRGSRVRDSRSRLESKRILDFVCWPATQCSKNWGKQEAYARFHCFETVPGDETRRISPPIPFLSGLIEYRTSYRENDLFRETGQRAGQRWMERWRRSRS